MWMKHGALGYYECIAAGACGPACALRGLRNAQEREYPMPWRCSLLPTGRPEPR
jgi:hypothetical protein